jgi:hypothetical protein
MYKMYFSNMDALKIFFIYRCCGIQYGKNIQMFISRGTGHHRGKSRHMIIRDKDGVVDG